MAKLVKMEIVFENVETITIPAKYIKQFFAHKTDSVTETLDDKTVWHYYKSDFIHLMLDGDLWNMPLEKLNAQLQPELKFGDRIIQNDITRIELYYDNGETEEIHVPWKGDHNYNYAMEHHLSINENALELTFDTAEL